jgi:hypothetical protein
MADFAVGATVMDGYFGWEAGSFVEVYAANCQQAGETLLANEPIADGIEELLGGERMERYGNTLAGVVDLLCNRHPQELKGLARRAAGAEPQAEAHSASFESCGHRVHRELNWATARRKSRPSGCSPETMRKLRTVAKKPARIRPPTGLLLLAHSRPLQYCCRQDRE